MVRPFKSILVDVDATATAQPALDRAVPLARATGAALRLVDVASAPGEARSQLRPDLEDEFMRHRREQLARLSYGIRDVTVDAAVLSGPPGEALIRDVLRFGHDLVVRSYARDVASGGFTPAGPIGLQLLRYCPCTVWVVGPGVPPRDPRIVGAIDAAVDEPFRRHLNAKVIDAALLLTDLQDGALTLLSAWHPSFEARVQSLSTGEEFAAYLDSARRTAMAGLAKVASSFGARMAGVRFECRRGDVEEVVPQFAVSEGVDVVVIGTTGRTGIVRRLIGSTAERLVRRMPCSIVAVKPDAFVSAVRG